MRGFSVWIFLLIAVAFAGCKEAPKAPPPDSISISVPYEFDSLDPHATITISNFALLSNFYEPLVRTDANMGLQPCLAQLWETPDPYTWIFELQPNAHFQSGKELTSEDVVYSLQRLQYDPELRIRGFLPALQGVSAIGPKKIRLKTLRPMTVFLTKLSLVLIVPKGSTTESLNQKVDGTGPYKLLNWKKGEELHIVRNEDYWGVKPFLREARYSLNRTPEQSIQDLISGRCALVQSNSKKLEGVVTGMSNRDLLIHSSLYVKVLGFDLTRDVTPYCNVKPNPFKNVLVRQAIHYALDRRKLVNGLTARATPATQVVPPFVFGYDPSISAPASNLVKARQLMAEAGLAGGFSATLHTRKILQETAELVRDQLKDIGIQVDLSVLPDNEFFPRMNNRDTSFFLSRRGCPSGDASDILADTLHSPKPSQEFGVTNYGDYENKDVDRLIEDSSGMTDVETRRGALQQIIQKVMADLPLIPLYIDQESYGLDKTYDWIPRNDSYIFAREINLRK